MNKKTVAIFVACMLLVCFASVYITIAYLTSTTEELTNTFTSGDVAITLDEGAVSSDGITIDNEADRITTGGNQYTLIPCQKYEKDPTIHVDADSEDAYIGAVIKIENVNLLPTANQDTLSAAFGINIDETVWTIVSQKREGNDLVAQVVLKQKATESSHHVIFSEITAPDIPDADVGSVGDSTNGTKIVVIAYAVQTVGFTAGEGITEANLPQHALASAFGGVFDPVVVAPAD